MFHFVSYQGGSKGLLEENVLLFGKQITEPVCELHFILFGLYHIHCRSPLLFSLLFYIYSGKENDDKTQEEYQKE